MACRILSRITFIVASILCQFSHTWTSTCVQTAHFPDNFVWGVATSAVQVEGATQGKSTWDLWQEWRDECGNPPKELKDLVGNACEHRERYLEDIELIKQSGANTYRFSIAWWDVQPEPGVFNQEAIEHYKNVCKALVANNIKPAITLHHYAEPAWFADLGGFEKEENNAYFVAFALKMVEALHDEVAFWFTFNSAAAYAMKAYQQGTLYHGKEKTSVYRAVEALKNILNAHVAFYRQAKALSYGNQLQIGILHNIFQLNAWHWFNPVDRLFAHVGNNLTNTCVYNFFKYGFFKTAVPRSAQSKNPDACGALDFVGLNYYSHGYFKSGIKIVDTQHETLTDNENYTVYPEGLYVAIKELSDNLACPLNIPIYVTENGIATDDHELREYFMCSYLQNLSEAIKDDYNVRGYILWALLDNYEWGSYAKHYGIYKVDFATQERTPKPIVETYRNIIEQYHAEHPAQ